jgi:hypothetical protein
MSQYRIERFISRFEKDNELSFVEVRFAIEPSLKESQAICASEPDDPMYEEVELDDETLKKLRRFVTADFDSNRYIYFLSCVDATD